MSASRIEDSAADNPAKGMLLIVVATFLFASHDAISKYLTGFYPVILVIWTRYFVHTFLMAAIFLPKNGIQVLRTRSLRFQVLRAVFLLSTSFFFTSSLLFIPMAEATAVHFLSPLVVIVISSLLLNEKVSIRQYVAVAFGFFGTLLIVRPGGALFSVSAFLPFCSALCFAIYQLLTRKVGSVDSPTTSNFLGGLFCTIALSLLLPFFWVPPESQHIPFMIALGTLGMVSHLLFTQSFRYAAPAILAPFGYCQLAFAGILGFVLFDAKPDSWGFVGMGIVALCGASALWKRRVAVVEKPAACTSVLSLK